MPVSMAIIKKQEISVGMNVDKSEHFLLKRLSFPHCKYFALFL